MSTINSFAQAIDCLEAAKKNTQETFHDLLYNVYYRFQKTSSYAVKDPKIAEELEYLRLATAVDDPEIALKAANYHALMKNLLKLGHANFGTKKADLIRHSLWLPQNEIEILTEGITPMVVHPDFYPWYRKSYTYMNYKTRDKGVYIYDLKGYVTIPYGTEIVGYHKVFDGVELELEYYDDDIAEQMVRHYIIQSVHPTIVVPLDTSRESPDNDFI